MKNGIKTYVCIGCGVTVTKSCTKKTKYCNAKCYHKYGKKGRNKTGMIKTCIICGNSFYTPLCRIKTAVTCSIECSNEYQSRNKITLQCCVCKNDFKISASMHENRKYCSEKCRYADPNLKIRLTKMNAAQMIKSPNKFETLAYSILKEINIPFEPQYTIDNKFTVDAFIPDKNIVIQFDGDYWHGNPSKYKVFDKRQRKRKALDISQDAYMKSKGIKVVRFWQSDFRNIQGIKEIILARCHESQAVHI